MSSPSSLFLCFLACAHPYEYALPLQELAYLSMYAADRGFCAIIVSNGVVGKPMRFLGSVGSS
jgi:hypothetical protein